MQTLVAKTEQLGVIHIVLDDNNENLSDADDVTSLDNIECSNDELTENNADNSKSRNIRRFDWISNRTVST